MYNKVTHFTSKSIGITHFVKWRFSYTKQAVLQLQIPVFSCVSGNQLSHQSTTWTPAVGLGSVLGWGLGRALPGWVPRLSFAPLGAATRGARLRRQRRQPVRGQAGCVAGRRGAHRLELQAPTGAPRPAGLGGAGYRGVGWGGVGRGGARRGGAPSRAAIPRVVAARGSRGEGGREVPNWRACSA